ncbi:hypothetical protein [Vibrio sp. 1180_3]|uniref:hypothetical protein n=1 Tax=Vibrio sp. 1180_3 TaxID=2528832 RepID=UPI002405CAAE|nr:hypothetical protein [Vibrio sp. 1180_3]MDF9401139.1 hypothetical protein [Vibrio sp. 1180_3]
MELNTCAKIATLVLVVAAGYILPSVTPDKVSFADRPLPKITERCVWEGQDCSTNHNQIRIYSGEFSPLQYTIFDLYKDGIKSKENSVFVTSDDQLFGVIKARKNHDGSFRVFIPFCTNEKMQIVIFSNNTSAILLPSRS